ncbi:glycosyltransferase [Patescibacteria group bacterium]|nr:glycosyltransferase [Patescibacteria group bacterium]
MQKQSNLKILKSSCQAAFLDVNIFAHEGFTSGALIQMKEILRRLLERGISVKVLSLAQASFSPNWKPGEKVGKSITSHQGIPVEEWLIEKSFKENPERYIYALKKMLNSQNWKVIFMNTPAVYLEKLNLIAMEEAINKAEVITVLPDILYPTYKTHPKNDVDRFYTLLKKTKVMAPSQFLIDHFFSNTGIKAELFLNLFTIDEITAKSDSHKYITLINHHPMKGRVIFDAVAKKMPEDKFLIIENWPDVPLYKPPCSNVKFSKFISDVQKLYGQTKILLVPSLCEEGCPRVVVEALLNGIPVIAHNIGGIPEAGLGVANLIDPPPVKGKVILPKVTAKDLERQANKFVSAICSIGKDIDTWKKHSRQSQRVALRHCERAETLFADLVKRWFSN